jgi:hypothetical protein
VNPIDSGIHTNFNIEYFPQALNCRDQKLRSIGDCISDVVRHSTVGKTGKSTHFKDDDLGIPVEASQSRGSRSSAWREQNGADVSMGVFAGMGEKAIKI